MCSNDDIILYQYCEFSNEVVVNMMKISFSRTFQ